MAARWWRQLLDWERPVRFAFLLALFLLALAALALAFGPDELRRPGLVGFFGLVIVAQAIFMWANRGMVMPYTRAQRLYLAEDFEGACALLENMRGAGKADARALTLLGNAYRQRNLLHESEVVLREALALRPNHYFPLYGFGRTLLVQGRYAEATEMFRQALDAGAPDSVQADVAEAFYRQGQMDAARRLIEAALPATLENHRLLMGRYLLYRLAAGPAPEPALIESGLNYWQAQAARYVQTPYGRALWDDVQRMQEIVEEAD